MYRLTCKGSVQLCQLNQYGPHTSTSLWFNLEDRCPAQGLVQIVHNSVQTLGKSSFWSAAILAVTSMKHVGIASGLITLPAALHEMVALKPLALNPLCLCLQIMMIRRKEIRSQVTNQGQMMTRRMRRILGCGVSISHDSHLHLPWRYMGLRGVHHEFSWHTMIRLFLW